MAAPSPQAMKERILSHMNKDHHRSLVLYLRHFSKMDKYQSSSANMEDITNENMTLSYAAGRRVIPFDPPLKSLSEARERLVAMHKEAIHGLGLEEVVIDSYHPPDTVFQWLLSAICLLIIVTFPVQDALLPESGSLAYGIWSAGGTLPQFAAFCHLISPYVWWFVVVVHAVESGMFAQKIQKFHVETGSQVWLLWVLDCMIEGMGCTRRFDRIAAEKAEKLKHST